MDLPPTDASVLNWAQEVNFPVTISDSLGVVIYMNDKSISMFADRGGKAILGTNMLNCHTPASNVKIKAMMTDYSTNIYTVERKGKKKLVYQTPWFVSGEFAGLVEMIFVLPDNLPNIKRS